MGILDKARKRLSNINEKKSEFAKTDFWKPHIIDQKDEKDVGDLVRMICPPYLDKPDSEPWVESAQYVFPIGKGKQYYTHAPSKFGLEDVVQEYRKELYTRGDEQSKAKAKTLGARDVYFALVIDLNEPEKGVQIWSFGNMIMEVLCNKLLNDEYNIFWDFEKGHDIIVKRYGEKMEDTKYVVDLSPKGRSVMDSIKRVMGDDFETFKLTEKDYISQAGEVDLANFVKVDTSETLEEILLNKWGEDYEERFKKRREERDAVHGRPLPLFIARESEVTAETVEHRRAAEEADAEIDNDPLFAAPKSAPVKESETDSTDKDTGGDVVGKVFSFIDVDASGANSSEVKGKCTAARIDEELGLCYILDCGELGTYEVPEDEVTEVVEVKKTRKFKKPEKTERQESVLDGLKKIKDEADK